MSRKSWNRWGFEWRRGPLSVDVNLDLINFPRMKIGWADMGDSETGYIALDWGNGNSDPVWSICYNRFIRAPRWLQQRWEREWRRNVERRRALRALGRCDLCEASDSYVHFDDGERLIVCNKCGHSCCHEQSDAS